MSIKWEQYLAIKKNKLLCIISMREPGAGGRRYAYSTIPFIWIPT